MGVNGHGFGRKTTSPQHWAVSVEPWHNQKSNYRLLHRDGARLA